MALHSHHGRRRLEDELARNGAVEMAGMSLVGPKKAKKMLRDGTAHGRPLTSAQKGLFGVIAGGGTPSRAKGFRG